MSNSIRPWLFVGILLTVTSVAEPDRKTEYVDAVVRGAGFMPWQKPGISEEEKEFRERIEKRKEVLLRHREEVKRPVMLSPEAIARIRKKVQEEDSVRQWSRSCLNLADYIIKQGTGYVEKMIPEQTPCNSYGFTCPACVGKKSQEAVGNPLIRWDYRHPDQLTCKECGQVYPSQDFPETATLQAPRSGQTFSYYLNEKERAHPENKTGELAYHWVGYPIHVSFTGIIREKKVIFMRSSLDSLAFAYLFTKDPKYARKTKEVLLRFAHCYRRWLYHDYWDTIADCDPMYAAWHDKSLPLEWKRHLSTKSFAKDRIDQAAMLQSYWGCGRLHPSTDSISGLTGICLAYDLVADAKDEDGSPVWTEEEKLRVERDLILESVIGAEPFVGGEGRADEHNNKTPRVYLAQASVAKCLRIPEFADVAIRGYEKVRDVSFLYDGMSTESPSYTNMYLSQLIAIPETLYGFSWPEDFPQRTGVYDPYQNDPRLELMYRSIIDQLRSDSRSLPLSDPHEGTRPSRHIIEYGIKRFPRFFDGKSPAIVGDTTPDQYGRFYLDREQLEENRPFSLPEIYFPAWMTSIFRHKGQKDKATLALVFNPYGGHRHRDNLSLYYHASGRGILGDHGYVGDMPINDWIRSTKSHNLVVVDDREQQFGGDSGRRPKLNLLATSPKASFVEAESAVYPQCSDYRRLVVLLKGPQGQTAVVDFFRVAGGDLHEFRLHSEVASSDSTGELRFRGIEFPEELPLPEVGNSLERKDIFGLRDRRKVVPGTDNWQAIWEEQGSEAYRFWSLTPDVAEVAASNGPGQRSLHEAGRRVRYLDVIRKGKDLKSLFVGVHESTAKGQPFPLTEVRRLPLPETAGEDAVALRIDSAWGSYLVLNEFMGEAKVEGMTFRGKLGIHFQDGKGEEWVMAASSETLIDEDRTLGFQGQIPSFHLQVESSDGRQIRATDSIEKTLCDHPAGFRNYFLVCAEGFDTGFPIESVEGPVVTLERFPLPKVDSGQIANLVFRRAH